MGSEDGKRERERRNTSLKMTHSEIVEFVERENGRKGEMEVLSRGIRVGGGVASSS